MIEKARTFGERGRKMGMVAEVNPAAMAFEQYPLNSDEFLNMPEPIIKALNEDQLKLLGAAYDGHVQGATIAMQDVVDFFTKLIGKATVCMSTLKLDDLNSALAKYIEAHPKKVVEQKPEIAV